MDVVEKAAKLILNYTKQFNLNCIPHAVGNKMWFSKKNIENLICNVKLGDSSSNKYAFHDDKPLSSKVMAFRKKMRKTRQNLEI